MLALLIVLSTAQRLLIAPLSPHVASQLRLSGHLTLDSGGGVPKNHRSPAFEGHTMASRLRLACLANYGLGGG